MNLFTVKSFPNSDMARTNGGLARGCERRGLHGAAFFRAFHVGRHDMGNPGVTSLRPQDLGCNELGYEWEGVDRVATRVDSKGLEARHGRRERNVQ